MPFDARYNRVYDALIAPACRRAGFKPERADNTGASERITDHILRQLLESEIVLGDLSSRNPNVLYELGVRHACGGSTVLVQAAGTERIFDIQDIHTVDYDSRLGPKSIERDIERVSTQIRSTHQQGGGGNLVFRSVGNLGHLGRHDEGYRSFLARLPAARRDLRVLSTFAYFLNDQPLIEDAFNRIAGNGGDARLLLLDPSSRAAAQRGQERPDRNVPLEIRNNLRSIATCVSAAGAMGDDRRLECRVFNSSPPFALFQCDDRATLIFYEYRKDLKDTQSLTFSTSTPLGRYVTRVFDEHWKNADTSMAIEHYLTLRAWFGRYLEGVHYLRGSESPAESGEHPDLWLLLDKGQAEEVRAFVESGRLADIDEVLPGRYVLERRPLESVRRVAEQKYGNSVAAGFECALGASRTVR
jgi:hypothetical protein